MATYKKHYPKEKKDSKRHNKFKNSFVSHSEDEQTIPKPQSVRRYCYLCSRNDCGIHESRKRDTDIKSATKRNEKRVLDPDICGES